VSATTRRPSLLSQHLALLGLDAGLITDVPRGELERLKTAELAPLDLPGLAAARATPTIELTPSSVAAVERSLSSDRVRLEPLPRTVASERTLRPLYVPLPPRPRNDLTFVGRLWLSFLGSISPLLRPYQEPLGVALGSPLPRLVMAVAALTLVLCVWRVHVPQRIGALSSSTSHVQVYWERKGEVQPWAPDVTLKNGDRLRTQVSAAENSVAFLAVTTGDGRLLSDPARVAAGALTLRAGQRRLFPGAMKLVGRDEGERLLVIVCDVSSASEAMLARALPGHGLPVALGTLPRGCSVDDRPLRGRAGA